MCSSLWMHKEHWLLSISTELARYLKRTIFKIGKPNYRFLKTVLYCHSKRSSFGEQALAYPPFYVTPKYMRR